MDTGRHHQRIATVAGSHGHVPTFPGKLRPAGSDQIGSRGEGGLRSVKLIFIT